MKPLRAIAYSVPLATALTLAGCWGSTKSKTVDLTPVAEPALVGSQSCIETCHAATTDHITGLPIADTWRNSIHANNPFAPVACESCHGGGGEHWGVGPIPRPDATLGCAKCHGGHEPVFLDFVNTAHYNANSEPPALFFQPDASTDNALYFGNPEFRPNGKKVTRGEHIQQCSVCHNPNLRFEFATAPTATTPAGDLLHPRQDALPVPRVGCAGCHNGHDPLVKVGAAQRGGAGTVSLPAIRKYLVDDTTGAQSTDNAGGTLVDLRGINVFWQPNGAVDPVTGVLTASNVVDNNNEVHPDRLCAACHARGKYLYSGADTHQEDIYNEWKESGHADRTAAAFAEFSANPGSYLPGADTSHTMRYPYDMALTSASATGPATTTRNVGNSGDTACRKCHHGIGSIAWQDNVEGTPAAPVLFGDVTVTCITCHDPHATGDAAATRRPKVMSKSPTALVPFSGNVFFDNTPVPSNLTGDVTICIFCHQGRESGLTLYYRRIDNSALTAGNFTNPHYLGTGAMLWGRNGYEFPGKSYGVNAEHQGKNCNGCHMRVPGTGEAANVAGAGGHTFNVVTENGSLNNAGCNVTACHGTGANAVPATQAAFADFKYGAGVDYDGDGTVEGVPTEIAGLEDRLIALLQDNGVYYSDTTYPYFLKSDLVTGYTAWSPAALKAAFNLQYIIKGLPSGTSQIGQPNFSAAVHNHKYTIQLLMDSYEALYTAMNSKRLPTPGTLNAHRPAGTRPATNYKAPGSTVYDAKQ